MRQTGLAFWCVCDSAGQASQGTGEGNAAELPCGGWIDSTPSVRGAQRNGTDPNTKMNWMGFRCARDVKDSGESQEAKPQQTNLR